MKFTRKEKRKCNKTKKFKGGDPTKEIQNLIYTFYGNKDLVEKNGKSRLEGHFNKGYSERIKAQIEQTRKAIKQKEGMLLLMVQTITPEKLKETEDLLKKEEKEYGVRGRYKKIITEIERIHPLYEEYFAKKQTPQLSPKEKLKTEYGKLWKTQEEKNIANYKNKKAPSNKDGYILVFDLDETLVANSLEIMGNENKLAKWLATKSKNDPLPKELKPILNDKILFLLANVALDRSNVSAILLLTNNSYKEYIDLVLSSIDSQITNMLESQGIKMNVKIFDYVIDRNHRFRKVKPWETNQSPAKDIEDVKNALLFLNLPVDNLEKRILFFDDLKHNLSNQIPSDNFYQIKPAFQIDKRGELVANAGCFSLDRVTKQIFHEVLLPKEGICGIEMPKPKKKKENNMNDI